MVSMHMRCRWSRNLEKRFAGNVRLIDNGGRGDYLDLKQPFRRMVYAFDATSAEGKGTRGRKE